MPPRKHVAKSQEHIYVKVGKGARAKYKLRATDIPLAIGSSSGATVADGAPMADPIISPPSADGTQSFNDNCYDAGDYETRPKRTGKVGHLVYAKYSSDGACCIRDNRTI